MRIELDNDVIALALGELSAASHANRFINDHLVPGGQRKCPICKKHMTLYEQHGVIIDTCAAHGTWLDIGELEVLLEATRQYRREMAALGNRTNSGKERSEHTRKSLANARKAALNCC